MSDNTTLPPGGGGDTIRTMDRTTSKTQVVGLDYGPDAGPENLVSASNGLPVAQIVGSVWNVTGVGTFSVSGTVAVSAVGGTVTVGGSVAVSNFPAVQPVSGSVTIIGSGPSSSASATSVVLASDQVVPVRLDTVGERPLRLGVQNREDSVPVTLAQDERILPVTITDGLDVVGTTARPLVTQLTAAQLAALSPLSVVSILGGVSVAGTVAASPVDTTTSWDTLPLRALLSEQRAQLYQQIQLSSIASGQFIPVPEMLPFLGA